MISVDTKKKELIGEYANAGREWHPEGEPTRVRVHDFVDPDKGRAIPYGVYDFAADEGWVLVGDIADSAEFAVESIRRWWNQMGKARYPNATRLLITADAGGSNGYRVRAWKHHLAELATETGLEITVCHYPPGTSKWNKIEHRMFSFISINWRGRPLTDIRTIIELIAATTTQHRAHHPSRLRPQLVPDRRQDHRPPTRSLPPHTTQLARRLELHHHPALNPAIKPAAGPNPNGNCTRDPRWERGAPPPTDQRNSEKTLVK